MIEILASDDGLTEAFRSTMDVNEAVTSRRAVRGFTDQPVPREVLERVLSAAAWSPSGSNLQPWHTYVLTGAPLAQLKKLAVERVAAGDPWDEREYEMYPPALKSPYRERRHAFAEQRYGALGIAREDIEARQRAAIANWDCFGAPAALFCYIDRDLGLPQWADVGMYLQTIMLLLRAEGLHSCPQMAWSTVRKTVAEIVSPPPGLILFCGMSIGYEDASSGLRPYAPGAARRDGHVHRGLVRLPHCHTRLPRHKDRARRPMAARRHRGSCEPSTALRYAAGITIVHMGWMLRLVLAKTGAMPPSTLVPVSPGLVVLGPAGLYHRPTSGLRFRGAYA